MITSSQARLESWGDSRINFQPPVSLPLSFFWCFFSIPHFLDDVQKINSYLKTYTVRLHYTCVPEYLNHSVTIYLDLRIPIYLDILIPDNPDIRQHKYGNMRLPRYLNT